MLGVIDIMESARSTPTPVNSLETPKTDKRRKTSSRMPKPSGMSREAFNLIVDQDAAADLISSVMPSSMRGYKLEKAAIGMSRVHKYRWTPFSNEARTDGLQLFHWVRKDKIHTNEPYIFASMNKVLKCETYNDEQYHQHLRVKNWTKEETDHLFDLCQRFDIRWPIVHDRFNRTRFEKPRTVEDLKERYYSVVDKLLSLKNEDHQGLAYDAEHERMRKEQSEKQWTLTRADMEEQAELQEHMKLIEAKRRGRDVLAEEYIRNYCLPHGETSKGETVAFKVPKVPKKTTVRLKAGSESIPIAAKHDEDSVQKAFRVPEFKTVGVHLRTQEILQVKGRVSNKREKSIKYLMALCQMDIRYTMGTEEIVTVYNDFKKNVVVLQELKESLLAAEMELRTLRESRKILGKAFFDIPPCVAVSSIPECGLLPSQAKERATTLRRLTAVVDKPDVNLDKNGVPIIPGHLINTPRL